MSDGTLEDFKVPEEIPDKKVVMTLTLTKEGQLQVSGMIQDKIVALGLLELAKSTLEKHWAASEVKIHRPGGILNFARNGHK